LAELDYNNIIVSRVEETSPDVLITLQGLIQEFNLCQVSQSINKDLLCNTKEHWRSLLEYAEQHTNVDPKLFIKGINPLSTLLEMDNKVIGKPDHEAATMYKMEFRNYVVFRVMVGPPAYKPAESFNDDKWLQLIFFQEKVGTFISRTNGSTRAVISQIKHATTELRQKDPGYPPIPASFFVAASMMFVKFKLNDQWSQRGMPNIQDLKDAIMEKEYY
jgi:hypothetical protein